MNITYDQLNEMLDLFDRFGLAMLEAGLCKNYEISKERCHSAYDEFRKPFINIIDKIRSDNK